MSNEKDEIRMLNHMINSISCTAEMCAYKRNCRRRPSMSSTFLEMKKVGSPKTVVDTPVQQMDATTWKGNDDEIDWIFKQ